MELVHSNRTFSEVTAVADAYDAKAADYRSGRQGHASFRAQCDLLSRWLASRSGRLLDIGCGSGDFLSIAGRGFRLPVGMDLSSRMLGAAAERLALRGKAALVRASATTLPFASRSFEVVSTMGVAEYVGALDVMLRECHRVLSPGGLLLLTCAHGACLAKELGTWLRRYCSAVKRLGKPAEPPELVIHFRSPDALDELLTSAGFRIRDRVFCGVRLFSWPLKDLLPRMTYGIESYAESWPALRRHKWTTAVYAVCADRV